MKKEFTLFGVHLSPNSLKLVLEHLNKENLAGKSIGIDITKDQLASLKNIRVSDLTNNLEFARDPHLNFAKSVVDFAVRRGARIIPLVASTRPGRYKKQELDKLEKARLERAHLSNDRRLFTPEDVVKEHKVRDISEYLKEQSIIITTKHKQPDFVIAKATRVNLFEGLPYKKPLPVDDRSLVEKFFPNRIKSIKARRDLILARTRAKEIKKQEVSKRVKKRKRTRR